MAVIREGRRVGPRLLRQSRIEAEILIVEDQRSLAIVLAEMLHERWGCRALIATSLSQVESIVALKQHKFLVAISDLNLPDAHSGEVIDILVGAGIPTIAVTGYFDQSMHDPIMGKGVIDYVLKNSINAYEYVVELVGRLHRNRATTVLVLEDDRSFSEVMGHMLRRQFLQVVTATSGKEAAELLAAHRGVKLALVDYRLPDTDGVSFVAELRRDRSKNEFAVIGMSGAAETMTVTHFLKVGANDFMAKPFTYEELVCRVSHNLQMLDNIEEINYAANHDYLTGLLNRRAFFDRAGEAREKATKSRKPLAVAMMDIDFFKKINDSHGHDGGDDVLLHVANLLREHFDGGIVGRLGGEEFAVVIPDADGFATTLERFRETVASSPANLGEKSVRVTISIGATAKPMESIDAALKLADSNLYRAKAEGRNRVVAD